MTDLSRLMEITRLNNISKGKAFLIAGIVAWSAFSCSFGNVNSASAASVGLLGQAGILTEGMHLGGVPYRNRNGRVVISGSASNEDNVLEGCQEKAQVVEQERDFPHAEV